MKCRHLTFLSSNSWHQQNAHLQPQASSTCKTLTPSTNPSHAGKSFPSYCTATEWSSEYKCKRCCLRTVQAATGNRCLRVKLSILYINKMSGHGVSQLERAPDSLRSAVDPTLQEVLLQAEQAEQHRQLSEQMHHQDYLDPSSGIQHPHVQEIMHSDHMHHSDQHDLGDDMSSPDRHEPFSPRRGYTHKRSEEPQRNGQGKMICKFQNSCSHLSFERRCEWR